LPIYQGYQKIYEFLKIIPIKISDETISNRIILNIYFIQFAFPANVAGGLEI